MDTVEFDLIAPLIQEYLGDELTWEDLQKGYSAFLEDEESENTEPAAAER